MRRFSIFYALMLATVLVSLPALAQQDVISTFIGGGPNGIPVSMPTWVFHTELPGMLPATFTSVGFSPQKFLAPGAANK